MCGIAALFHYGNGPLPDPSEIRLISEAMVHRGPDGSGVWTSADRRVMLAHRRLALVDLSPFGAQPMANPADSLVLTFNGEIYNHRALRNELLAQGCHFRGTSDTEVILQLYLTYGEAMVHRLQGMFAFALWDAHRRGLFVVRDPLGIKPLYYADDGSVFRTASQVKALLAGQRVSRSPDPAGHVSFFLWGHVAAPYTLHRSVRSLTPGSALWLAQDGFRRETRFGAVPDLFRSAEVYGQPGTNRAGVPWRTCHAESPNPCSFRDELLRSLEQTIQRHLQADVPVAAFLSSGIDSATVVSLATRRGQRLRTVTLGFEEFRGTNRDETILATRIARHCGTDHATIWLGHQDFQRYHVPFFAAMDQPTIDGLNTYAVSKAAAGLGFKAVLSGLGGDELFAGYPSFHQIPTATRWLSPFRCCPALGKSFRVVSAALLRRTTIPKYAGLLEFGTTYPGSYLLRRGLFMPWELPDLLDPELVRMGWRELQPLLRLEEHLSGLQTPRLKVSCLETMGYLQNQLLRDSDWAGMAHSVEIRVPFVDVELLRSVLPLCARPDGPSKQDLARCCGEPITSALLHRPKSGFGVPLSGWWAHPGPSQRRLPAESRHTIRAWARHVYSQFTTLECAS
jgi:asparagine synthase (glutamine-hydrolysing)